MTSSVKLRARRAAIRALQRTGLNVAASKFYYRYVHRFEQGSPGLEDGFKQIFSLPVVRNALEAGDYLEFGMFKGHSFWLAQKHVKALGVTTRFIGFDSFQGLPEPEGIDVTPHGEFRRGQYACTLESVRKNLEKAGGIAWDRTHLVKGFFEDSLTPGLAEELRIKQVGVAMIDCDLYSSTRSVLAWLHPLIRSGSILIFDDWNSFGGDPEKGQRRAAWEFLSEHRHLRLDPIAEYGLNAKAFVVKQKRALAAHPAVSLAAALLPLVA